jgi:hypothetical protein
MNLRRVLALAFSIAFVLGGVAAALILHARHTVTPAMPVPSAAGERNRPVAPISDKVGDVEEDNAPPWPDAAGSPEQVMYAQAQLMDAAVAKLSVRIPGKTNLYLIAFAGDGAENVFRNEVDFVQTQFERRFDAAGHTLVLINNPATLDKSPLASLSNLEAAIDAVAEKMNPDEDVLLLFLTSHGSPEHELYVAMDPLPLDQIAPEDLADIFATTSIRNKVIVISACYSGGFIDELKDSTTMVITAARADRTSFGCGTNSPITNFSRAFFADALNQTDSFSAAFAQASKQIDAQETRDGLQHSYPQIATTAQIEAKLGTWRAGLKLGAPVKFSPPQVPAPP